MNVANWNLKVYPRFRGYSEGEYAEGCEDVSDDDACLAKAPSAASNLRWYRYGLGRIGIAVLRFPCDFGSQCYLRNFAPDFGLWYFNCQWGLRLAQFGIWSFYPVVHWKHPRFVKYQRSAKGDISRSRQISTESKVVIICVFVHGGSLHWAQISKIKGLWCKLVRVDWFTCLALNVIPPLFIFHSANDVSLLRGLRQFGQFHTTRINVCAISKPCITCSNSSIYRWVASYRPNW